MLSSREQNPFPIPYFMKTINQSIHLLSLRFNTPQRAETTLPRTIVRIILHSVTQLQRVFRACPGFFGHPEFRVKQSLSHLSNQRLNFPATLTIRPLSSRFL